MVDTTYDITTLDYGTFTADFNTADLNSVNRGESASFEFEITIGSSVDALRLLDGESHTVASGTTEQYSKVYVNSGGTLTIDGTLETNYLDNEGTINNNGTLTVNQGLVGDPFAEYLEWAGSYTTLETLNNTVKYRNQLPEDALISSVVVGIEPNSTLAGRDVRGVWCLLDSVTDQRNQPLTTDRYSVEATVLAPITEYSDHTELQNDLEI